MSDFRKLTGQEIVHRIRLSADTDSPGKWSSLSSAAWKMELAAMSEEWKIKGPTALTSSRPIVGPLVVLLKKIIRRALAWYMDPLTEQITHFNIRTARVLQSFTEANQKVIDEMEERLKNLEELRAARRFARLEALAHRWGSLAQSPAQPSAVPGGDDSQIDYFLFEDEYRDSARAKETAASYVDVFDNRQNVLDIGCGRGHFLELLAERGVSAFGIDLDLDMVLVCQEKGLKAEQAEALSYLATLKDGSLGGVYLGQVVEHFQLPQLVRLVELCHSKLNGGGIFAAETINPTCLFTFSNTFYLDPSHTKPLHPLTMKFLLKSVGFEKVDIRFLSPLPEEMRLGLLEASVRPSLKEEADRETLNENFTKLNNLLFSYQDYVIIAQKPETE